MKDKTIFSSIGIILFFILTAIDKFIIKLHPALYIIVGLTSITLIIIGFLNDKKKQPIKKKLKTLLLALLITLLITIVYINPFYIYRNNTVIKHIENIKNKSQIEIKELIPFDFDKIYIAYPYTDKEQIENDLNIKSRYIKDNIVNDQYQEIIIIKDNKVISSFTISLEKNNFTIQPASSNIIENKEDNIFIISNYDNKYYFYESPKKQEINYKDITLTIPSTWYKETTKEDYLLHYPNTKDKTEYLKINTLDTFKETKYLKDLEVLATENLTNQFYEIFYYKIKKDNNYIEQRIILKSDQIYEFIFLGKESNSVLYKEQLIDIIESIK